ncbi:alpha/beta hydrolase [Halomicroarcula sp. F13]|uniref:Alpha/beta hydrolase n=1 Tax=Haloarcula rubra TaxID=2487747 RepID=A0AAW4PW24_9EURY|nr:alpha/beta hydrolase [Halomicroarcula rubra]MBX0324314.1 alpha/beta hydrolase [Halomicroarcula rubra]
MGPDGSNEGASPTTTETTSDATASSSATESTTTTGSSDVSFDTSGGATVEGTLYGAGDCGVVLVPQINLDRESWRPQAERLASNGWLALAIDEGEQRVAAVRAAVEFLRSERAVSSVVLVGASTGGAAIVGAAAEIPDRVDGVVTLSAAGGAERAGALTGQKLFVVSEGDEQRFVDIATRLHDDASDPKRLLTFDGAAHGQRLFESEHSAAVWSAMFDLLGDAC